MRLPSRLVFRLTEDGRGVARRPPQGARTRRGRRGRRPDEALPPSEQSRRPMPRRPSVVSVLDVGSTKICCLIARLVAERRGSRGDPRPHPRHRGARLRPPALARHQVRRRGQSRRRRAGDPPGGGCRRAAGRRHRRFAHRQLLRRAARQRDLFGAASPSPASRWKRPTSAACWRRASAIR